MSVRRILIGHRVQLPHAIVCIEWTSALFAARIKCWKLLPVELGAVRPSVRPLDSYSPNPASMSQRTLLRQTPKVRTVCGKAARTDPCGGRSKELSLPRPIHLPAGASWREWTRERYNNSWDTRPCRWRWGILTFLNRMNWRLWNGHARLEKQPAPEPAPALKCPLMLKRQDPTKPFSSNRLPYIRGL